MSNNDERARRLGHVAVAAAILTTALAGCGNDEPILEVAYVAPQTGLDEADSVIVRRVLEHYFEQVNENGGINGRPITLGIYDDKGTPADAKTVAEVIAGSDAFGVIGHRTSPCSAAASPVYSERHIPAITPWSVYPALTQTSDWYFRTTLDSEQQALYGVAYIREAFHAKSFSVVYVDLPDIEKISRNVEATAAAAGVTVDVRHSVPMGVNSERLAEVTQALSTSSADTPIFLILDVANGAEMVRRLRDAGVERPVLGPTIFANYRFASSLINLQQSRIRPHYYTDGLHIMTPALLDTGSARFTEVARWYANKFGQRPNLEALLAVDAATLFVEGAREVLADNPTLDKAALREAVRDWIANRRYDNSIEGLTGKVYFDEDGNRVRSVFLAELHDGRVISAPTQLRLLPKVTANRDLPPGHEPERVVRVGDTTLYRTDIVYAGFRVHSLGELDERTLTFEADLDFWFRHRQGIEGWNVRLLNASEDVTLGEPLEALTKGGVEYRRFRVTGRFNADVIPAPYGRHTLGFAFRHPYLTSDSVLYAFDFTGLGVDTSRNRRAQRFKEIQQLLPANSSWIIYDAVYFQDKVFDTTRGRPEADGHPAGEKGFSRLAFGVRVQRSDMSPRTLTPSHLARPIAIGSLLLTLVLFGLARTERGQKHLGVFWFFQAIAAAVFLLSSEKALGDLLSEMAPVYYQQLFGTAYAIGWWLVPAVFIHVAVHRFIWAPIERESQRPVPSILRRMVALTIYLLAIFGVVAFVFEEKLTSLLATSGVVAMIVGLAIQINIANIFSGIALNMERPFRLGDWIMVHGRTPNPDHGTIGQVIDINWRTTRLKTTDNTVIVIPNAVISEKTVTNFMMPDERSRFEQLFYLDYAVPHERGLELIGRGLMDATEMKHGPLADPKPKVRVNGTTDLGVEYLVRYWLIPRLVSPSKARNSVTSAVLAAVRGGGEEPSYPKLAIRDARTVLDSEDV